MGWEDFRKNTQFVVGVGYRVKFWQDGVRINLSNWLSWDYMVLPLIGRLQLSLLWQGWG